MDLHPNAEALRIYRRLMSYARPYRLVLIPAVVGAAIYAALTGVAPYLLEGMMDELMNEALASRRPFEIPALVLVVFGVRGATDILTVYGLSWVGRSVVRDLRGELFARYLTLPASEFDKQATGDLISRLTYNTEQVAEAISSAVVSVVRDSLTMLVLLGVMVGYSPMLTLIVAIIGPLAGALVSYMSRAFRRYSARIQGSMGAVTRVAEQSLQGHRVVKMYEGQTHEEAQFGVINAQNFRLNQRLVATRALGDALTQYVVVLGTAAIIYLVLADSLLEQLTVPVFTGFIMAMAALLAPLKRLTNINAIVQRGVAAAGSIFATLDMAGESDTGTQRIERARGDVEYRDVSFTYRGSSVQTLTGITLTARAGSRVALVGRSGSGKSTLVSLLPRLYDAYEGEIRLDGIDIRSLRLVDLRRQISFVSQEVVLFDDTIAGNIAYGALERSTRREIEAAADAAHVTEFARELSQGLDSRVGERGLLLSGGQRQRVAIARALLKDAPILILDEATSALDTESERHVQDALARLMVGRTTLVIAHRLSTVETADCIIALKDGRIVEQGTHAELLRQDGYYSTLHRMQFAE